MSRDGIARRGELIGWFDLWVGPGGTSAQWQAVIRADATSIEYRIAAGTLRVNAAMTLLGPAWREPLDVGLERFRRHVEPLGIESHALHRTDARKVATGTLHLLDGVDRLPHHPLSVSDRARLRDVESEPT